MGSDFIYWMCTWPMGRKVRVAGCVQDEERSEELALRWRWGRHPAPLPWGVFVSGARHSPTARAQPHIQPPQPPSFLNPEFCFRAALMVGRLSVVVYACFSMTQKGIFVILYTVFVSLFVLLFWLLLFVYFSFKFFFSLCISLFFLSCLFIFSFLLLPCYCKGWNEWYS